MIINEDNFIRELICRNQRAVEYVIDEYGGLIKSVVMKNLGGLEMYADECINDILLAVWNNADKFDSTKNTFKNWLCAVAKYKCIDCRRRYAKQLYQDNIDDMELADSGNCFEKIEDDFGELLSCLSDEDRELFYKKYILEESTADIAEAYGNSTQAVYTRLSRGRRRLKADILKKRGGMV